MISAMILHLARAGGGQIFSPGSSGGSSGGIGGGIGGGGGYLVPVGGGVGSATTSSGHLSAGLYVVIGLVVVGIFIIGFVSAARYRTRMPETLLPNPNGPPRGRLGGTEDTPPTTVSSPAAGSPFSGSNGFGGTSGGPGGSGPEFDSAKIDQGIASIRAHDPQFDTDGFIEGVERSFFVVQQAWCDQKPELSRPVMADGVWRQQSVQIEQYKNESKRNVLDGLALAHTDIVGATSEAGRDKITVSITAACADYDIDSGGRIIRGDRSVRQWREHWLFERASSATTRSDGGTMSSKCPNCGAPLDVDLQGVCQFCHSPVMNGELDWVLARIDQVDIQTTVR